MTLADFARSIGISPATARQWKRRGKIVERDSGFELDAGVTPGTVTLRSEATGVTVDNRTAMGVIGNLVNPKRDSVTVGDLITDGSGATSKVTGVTVDCNGGVTVSAEGPTDSAQDSRLCRREDSAGGTRNPESRRESCAGCKALQERVTELEQRLVGNVETLQRFVDGLRDRVSALEGNPLARSRVELNKADAELERAIEELGKPGRVIDPPGPSWGA